MPQKWGQGTSEATRGARDPNILTLREQNRVRPLEDQYAAWRQHIVESRDDPEQVTFITCPGRRACPLCRKPTTPSGDQYWPVSRRFAANVWDYESGSVKILIGGPRIFEEFDAAGKAGIDPKASDWIIGKTGTGRATTYKVTRLDRTAFEQWVTPQMLHDISKFETPASEEQIFEALEKMGIDYDSLPVPEYTLDEALAFALPFGKHKGMTLEQVLATDDQYARWLYDSKVADAAFGDALFIALHVIYDARGQATDVEQPEPSAPAPAPQTDPTDPAPQPDTTGTEGITCTLVGPTGDEVVVPVSAVEALKSQGFTEVPAPEPEKEPVGDWMVEVGGARVTLPIAQAKAMLDQGIAKPVPEQDYEAAVEQLHREQAEPTAEAVAQDNATTGFACSQCDWKGKTQGSLTQHINRTHAEEKAEAAPAQTNGGSGKDAVLERVKDLVSKDPRSKDYGQLLNLFQEVAGKRNITDFTEDELLQLEARLQA